MRSSLQNILINSSILFFVVLICFMISEGFVRIVIDNGMEYNLEMWKYARKLKRVAERSNQGHLHIPNRSAHLMGVDVDINSHGHRSREISMEKTPGVTRIMMLGDSLTFGWGVPAEDTVSAQLEKLYGRDGRPIEVINTGIGNTNAEMQISTFLDKGVLFSPDIVVLNYFINDAEPIPRPTKNLLMKYSAAYVFLSLRMGSITRLFFGGKQWHEYYNDLYDDNFEGWKRAKSSIYKLAEYCQSKGIKLLIVNYPELHKLNPYPFEMVTNKVKSIAVDKRVPFLDLLPSLQGEREENLWVSIQDQHPNSLACKLIAPAIKEAIEKNFTPFSNNFSKTASLVNFRPN